MLNVNGTTWLLHNATFMPGPCCVFGDPWYPPTPTDIATNMVYSQTTDSSWTPNGETLDWYKLSNLGPPLYEFGYAFISEKSKSTPAYIPGAFYFTGVEPETFADTWIQQNFYDFSEKPFSASIFDIPDECIAASNCGFMMT
jgi:hypothetical protein